jgi:hypothetical protein
MVWESPAPRTKTGKVFAPLFLKSGHLLKKKRRERERDPGA